MNNTLARKKAADEIKEILDACDCLSGITLTPSKIQSTSKVLYWRTSVTKEEAFQKNIYIIYTVTSSDVATNSDNKVRSREVVVAIDIYTNKDLNTREVVTLTSNIENELVEHGWDVVYERELFDNETKLNHIPLTVSKDFKKEEN